MKNKLAKFQKPSALKMFYWIPQLDCLITETKEEIQLFTNTQRMRTDDANAGSVFLFRA
jgi:hypothetical protein